MNLPYLQKFDIFKKRYEDLLRNHPYANELRVLLDEYQMMEYCHPQVHYDEVYAEKGMSAKAMGYEPKDFDFSRQIASKEEIEDWGRQLKDIENQIKELDPDWFNKVEKLEEEVGLNEEYDDVDEGNDIPF